MMIIDKTCRAMICRCLVVIALMAAIPVASFAQQDAVTLNFVNADIESVVKAVGEVTNKNFIIDPRVKGQINVVSSKPISRAQVYDLLLSALRLQGFTAVESGGFVRIVPEADAKLYTGPVTTESAGSGDRLVTQIFKLRHESANQMVNVLKPLISPNNSITAAPGTNSLVITDYADNLDRLAKIIASIDRPTGDDIEVIAVRHMSAIDLASTLNQIYGESGTGTNVVMTGGGGGDGPGKMTIIPETRSNALVVRGASPTRLAGLISLIQKLDTPMNATGNIHVVYLRNAEAIKLAAVLRSVMEGDSSSLQSAWDNNTSSSFSQGMLGLNSGTGSGTSSSGSTGLSNVASTLGSSFNNSSSSTLSNLMGGGADSKGGMIQADPMTNALIINAPEPVYRNLRAVIDLLDARRAQVFIESLIVEVTSDTAAEFGIQWQGLSGFDKNGTQVIGGTNYGNLNNGNILGAMTDFSTVRNGLNIGIMKGSVNIPGIGEVTNLSFLAHALESEGKTNILSTPNMLTLDNEEATIVVGQNIPIMTGSYASTGTSTSVTPFQTYDRQDVGLTLKIKPQISESGTVRLQIYQEISSVATSIDDGGIITNKRAIESQVLVDDGQIVVLGGLIQDSISGGEDGIPVLKDIPVLGYLFKTENRSRTKTNLMVFLRPHILRDAQGSKEVTDGRYRYIYGVQQREQYVDNLLFKGFEGPHMPAPNEATTTLFPNDARAQGSGAYPTSLIDETRRQQIQGHYGNQPIETHYQDGRPVYPMTNPVAPAPQVLEPVPPAPVVATPPMVMTMPAAVTPVSYAPAVQTEVPVAYYDPQPVIQTETEVVLSPTPVQTQAPAVQVSDQVVRQTQAPRVALPVEVEQARTPQPPQPVVYQTTAPRTVIVPPSPVSTPMPTGPLPVRRQTAFEALEAGEDTIRVPVESYEGNWD